MKTRRILMTVVFTLTILFALYTVSIAQDNSAVESATDEEALGYVEDDAEYADLLSEIAEFLNFDENTVSTCEGDSNENDI